MEPIKTFNVEKTKISKLRIEKWRKRRLQKDDDAEDGSSLASEKKMSKQKHQNKKKKLGNVRSYLEEEPGYLVFESDEEVDDRFSQTDIASAVDTVSAEKFFELILKDFGPYHINYSRNGRHLLLGGMRGHMAAFDWQTKKLSCEFNAMETVNSIKWLHQETLFAVAQRSGVFVYDNQGLELHNLQKLDSVLRLEFLPHHMLLVTANSKGFLAYTDVSMGTDVAGICTGLGRLDTMTHNPANAIIHLGHASGVVTLWAPTVKDPLMKILTHKAPVKSIAIHGSGNYMATSGVDKRVKVFDLRTQKLLSATHVPMGASSLAFSQRGMLAASFGNKVQVYKDCTQGSTITPYLGHVLTGAVQEVQFCPFEDVLGVGHQSGFTSMIVPGSGEPTFDGLVVNPYETKKQRNNTEVRLLLDKLQPEMIGLTNWVLDISKDKSGGAKKEPKQKSKKLGKKEKEEQQRELTRSGNKDKPEKGSAPDKSNPLSRFKKANV